MPIPYPTAKREDYWPLTAAMVGMANPLLAVSNPISPKPGEAELLLKIMKNSDTSDIVRAMLEDRVKNAMLSGRMGEVNPILEQFLVRSGAMKQYAPGAEWSILDLLRR